MPSVYFFYDLLTYYVRMYIMLIHIQHKMHHTYLDADNQFSRGYYYETSHASYKCFGRA